jgi:hypothetical protein
VGPTLPDLFPSGPDPTSYFLQIIATDLTPSNDSSIPVQPPIYVPPSTSTFQAVSSLWFLSLVSSLTCALLALSLLQWTRRYLLDVRQRGTLCNQARVREYLAEGIHDSGIAILVDVMRACHQISFALFAIGLSIYLSLTVTVTGTLVITWFTVWAGLYLWMTMTAKSRDNSPYHSPLSSILYRCFRLLILPGSITLQVTPTTRSTSSRVSASNGFRGFLRKMSPGGMRKATEDSAKYYSEWLDRRILVWTFNSLNKDHEFERFFAGIPGFCDSRVVNDPMKCFLEPEGARWQKKFSRALFGWIHRTMTSDLISEPARLQRIKICLKVFDALPTLVSWSTLRSLFDKWEGSVDSRSAASRAGGNSYGTTGDPCTSLYARCIVVILLARAQQPFRDRDWFDLITQFSRSNNPVSV